MKIGQVDLDKTVLIVAEIGNNHEGNFSVAEEMLRRAAMTGVDAVKFQTFKTELFVRRADADRFRRLKSFELTYEQFARLSELARSEGVLFLSTPLDLESADFLTGTVSAFKVASGDNNFVPLLEAVARGGRPVLLSGGIATVDELRLARETIRRVWREEHTDPGLAVLHCVSSYPVPADQANLAAIRHLERELSETIGYSDHTLGIEAAALSVAVGARIVEKHFTLDHNYSDFPDHRLSADPREMAELVRRIRRAEVLLGSGDKLPQACEASTATALRRSIFAGRDLPAGATLQWDDIVWLRPGDGLAPGREAVVLGRTLRRPIPAGQAITPDAFEHPHGSASTESLKSCAVLPDTSGQAR